MSFLYGVEIDVNRKCGLWAAGCFTITALDLLWLGTGLTILVGIIQANHGVVDGEAIFGGQSRNESGAGVNIITCVTAGLRVLQFAEKWRGKWRGKRGRRSDPS